MISFNDPVSKAAIKTVDPELATQLYADDQKKEDCALSSDDCRELCEAGKNLQGMPEEDCFEKS